MTNIPVTVATRLTPVRGQEDKLRAWFKDIASDAARFDGYLGSDLFQAISGQGECLWLSIFTFDTPERLETWMQSEVRAGYLATGVELFGNTAQSQQLVGIEFWFDSFNKPGIVPPPKWKMALVSGLVILVLSNTMMPWFSAAMNRLHVPLWVTAACSTGLMISLMTWAIMPWVTRALRGWLVKGSNSMKKF
jgi:antibiotic biosynthesis monooxygenase (ABM) superfamily enzyme